MMSPYWFRRTYGIAGGVFVGVLALKVFLAQQRLQRVGGSRAGHDLNRRESASKVDGLGVSGPRQARLVRGTHDRRPASDSWTSASVPHSSNAVRPERGRRSVRH